MRLDELAFHHRVWYLGLRHSVTTVQLHVRVLIEETKFDSWNLTFVQIWFCYSNQLNWSHITVLGSNVKWCQIHVISAVNIYSLFDFFLNFFHVACHKEEWFCFEWISDSLRVITILSCFKNCFTNFIRLLWAENVYKTYELINKKMMKIRFFLIFPPNWIFNIQRILNILAYCVADLTIVWPQQMTKINAIKLDISFNF